VVIVKKVILNNVKTHSKREFDFEKGINLILGPNGSGKTTLVESIFLALFGGDFARVIDYFKKGEKTMAITLILEDKGKTYRIRRKWVLENNAKLVESSLELIDTIPKKLASDHNKLLQQIKHLFGLDKKIIPLIYYKQNEITKIIEMDPRKRKEWFDEILGIKDLEEFSEKLKMAIKLIKTGKISRIEDRIKLLKAELNKKSLLENKLKNYKEKLVLLSNELENLEKEYKILENQYKEYLELKAKLKSIEGQINNINVKEIESKINNIREELNNIEELTDYEKDILSKKHEIIRCNEIKNRLKELEKEIKDYDKIKKEFLEIESKYKQYEEKRLEYEKAKMLEKEKEKAKREYSYLLKEKESLEKEIAELQNKINQIKELEKMEQELLEIQERIGVIKAKLKLLENIKDRCPLCGAKLSSDTIEHLQKEREKLQKEYYYLKEKYNQLLIKIRALEKYKGLEKVLEAKTKHLETIENRLKEIKPIIELEIPKIELDESIPYKYKQLLNKVSYLEAKIKEYERYKNIECPYDIAIEELKRIEDKYNKYIKKPALERELNLLLKELERYNSLLKEKEEILSKLNPEIETKYKELTKKKENLLSEISKVKGIIKEIESQIKEIEKHESTIKQLEEKKRKWEKLVEKLNRIVKALGRDGIPKALREGAINYINDMANIYLREFTDKYKLKVNNDLSIYAIPIDNPHYEIEAKNLSGGEKVVFSLSIALAIISWLSLQNMFMVLDEPTANLDNERTLALRKTFDKLEKMVEQAIIVTHNELLDTGENHVVRL